jgi:hypothetical protein
MFPDIHGQQRFGIAGQRRASVAGGDNAQAAIAVFNQPCPASTKVLRRRVGKLRFELCKAAEGLIDSGCQLTFRFAARIRREAVPVESMVPDLGRIVKDAAFRRADDRFKD